MRTKLSICLIILLTFSTLVYSQNILEIITKYDFKKIEEKCIKKTKKLLNIPDKQQLHCFTYFAVSLSKPFCKETDTCIDFLNHFKLCDKYRCYVYNDSLRILTMFIENYVLYYPNTTPDNISIEYIRKLNPEYVFEYMYSPFSNPTYFCLRNNEITIVYVAEDRESIISYSLNNLKDWTIFNT
jgi:hypothetical protein